MFKSDLLVAREEGCDRPEQERALCGSTTLGREAKVYGGRVTISFVLEKKIEKAGHTL